MRLHHRIFHWHSTELATAPPMQLLAAVGLKGLKQPPQNTHTLLKTQCQDLRAAWTYVCLLALLLLQCVLSNGMYRTSFW